MLSFHVLISVPSVFLVLSFQSKPTVREAGGQRQVVGTCWGLGARQVGQTRGLSAHQLCGGLGTGT